ncbi:MAG: protein kinase, partial [Myxococcota bacterium]
EEKEEQVQTVEAQKAMTQMILGKYRLLLELPDDEPVQTWLGCQEQAGALVYRVLKVPPEVATRKEHLRLFHGYARRAMLIDHGGVARTIEASVDGDSYYIVTELVRGESLPRLVERVRRRGERVMSMMTALQIAAAAADALHAAHANRDGEGGSRSVVHGELAPQHVMIGYSGEVKLIDLPVATASRAIKVDAHGTMTGDLAYMSPEQCMGESADNRSNVFSLAVILWELLTGRKLFEQRDPFDLMTAITEGPVLLPSKVNSDVPPFLDALLNKALQKDPKQRLSDCSKFARALRQVIQRVQGAGSELGLELLMVELFPDRAALWQEFGRAESLGDVYNIERAARELFDLAPLAPQESLRVTTDLDAELTSSQQPSDEFGLGGVIDDAFAMLSSNQSGPPIQQARAPLPPEPPPGLTVPSTDHDRTKVYNREDAKAAVSEETVVKPRPSAPRDDEDPFATLRHDSLGAEVESRSSDTGLDFSFEPTPPDPSVEVLFIDDVPGTEESTQPSPDPISWAPDAWEPERAQDEPDFGLDSSRSLEPSVALASDKVVVDSVMGAGLEFEPAPASASSLRRAARVGAPVPEAYDGDDAYGRWYFGEDEDDELFESAIPMEEVFSPDVVEADVPGAVKAIQGVESRPVLQIVRIRDGVAVESRTLRGLLKRYAPKGAKIKVKLNNKKAALEPNGAQGWIRRKNSLQAESLPLASKSIPMGVGDIIEVGKTAFHWGFLPTILYLGFSKGSEPGMPELTLASLLWA